jgi:acyl-CoA dehydrogenase
VASSDATNIEAHIRKEGDEYVINGRKWWISGVGDPRCKVVIFMGKTAPDIDDRYRQQSMIVVPTDTPGFKIERLLPVFGFDAAPHGHGQISFTDVRVPVDNILLGEGRGFEIAQARLGPGRIHHCMRSIGVAERTLEQMCKRVRARFAFGKYVSEQTVTQERIAEARIMIDQARLLVLQTAHKMDTIGNKEARKDIAMIKVAVPNMACKIIDWAIQAYGGAGVTTDPGLAAAYAHQRTLRLADGPDEVHRNQIARLEMRRYN